jgi:hypothetical protein
VDPFRERDVLATEALDALELLEEFLTYAGRPIDLQRIALVRLVLRRQTMLLENCQVLINALPQVSPMARKIYLAINAMVPVMANLQLQQQQQEPVGKEVPRPTPQPRDDVAG